jgi:two-component SAPR family response regulator
MDWNILCAGIVTFHQPYTSGIEEIRQISFDAKEYKTFVGECYVHGLMEGETLDWLRDGRAKLETIVIG